MGLTMFRCSARSQEFTPHGSTVAPQQNRPQSCVVLRKAVLSRAALRVALSRAVRLPGPSSLQSNLADSVAIRMNANSQNRKYHPTYN